MIRRLAQLGVHLGAAPCAAVEPDGGRDGWGNDSEDVLAPESSAMRGQRFQVSRSEGAEWGDGLRDYFEYRNLGIQKATADQFRALLLRVKDEKEGTGPITMGHHTTGLHRHEVEFQMVFVLEGWMRFVFEGEGEHLFEAGDCWVQPAGITHNELECSDDLVAFEFVTPAVHETVPLDELAGSPPTEQKFHVSKASDAAFGDGLRPYFEYRDLGINDATNGKFKAHLLRVKASEGGTGQGRIEMGQPTTEHTTGLHTHGVDFQMNFVLQVILTPAPGVSNEVRSSPLLALAPPFLAPGFGLGLVGTVSARR